MNIQLLAAAALMTALAVFVAFLIAGAVAGAPFFPARRAAVEAMAALAAPAPGELWVDLGSGDGGVLIAAANAGARALGYEINPVLVLVARLRIRWSGARGQARVVWGSYWGADLSGAAVVSVYGIPHRMKRIQDKLRAELRPGARVVSLDFPFPDWPAARMADGVALYRVT